MKNSSKKIVTVSSIAPRDEEDPIAGFMRGVLQELSEDPEREGLKKTPDRVAKALRFLTQGYDQDVMEVLNGALFAEDHQEMVVLKDIVIYSLCEHHLLPFFGKCHVAYVPNKKIVGLSKIARLVDVFARRLQVQERMTNEIANVIMQVLDPLGVAVVIEAEHLCMQMRGVQKRGSVMITSAMLGAFRNRQETRAEFMKLIRG